MRSILGLMEESIIGGLLWIFEFGLFYQQVERVDAIDLIVVGALSEVDSMDTCGVEEIELANTLRNNKMTVLVEMTKPCAFVVTEQDGAEECPLLMFGTFDGEHYWQTCLVVARGVDNNGGSEVVAVVGVGCIYLEPLGIETKPCVFGKCPGIVE